MKNNLKRTFMVVATVLFSLSAATANAKVIFPQNGEVNNFWDLLEDKDILLKYMKIKNALVNDDFEKVKEVALKMNEGLQEFKLTEAQYNSLRDVIVDLANAEDLANQRSYFAQLSQHIYQLAQKIDLTDQTLYLQSCGMAFDGQGAGWISYDEEVRNPFMGQKMPECGSVEEKTIR